MRSRVLRRGRGDPCTASATSPRRSSIMRPATACRRLRALRAARRGRRRDGRRRRCPARSRGPCRRRRRRRPARASRTARAIAAARSGSTTNSPAELIPAAALRAPSLISARMASGSSERGLSLVRNATSAPKTAAAPISGRLPRSRSPPQPSTSRTRPGTSSRTVSSRLVTAAGRVGVVDEREEGLARVDPLHPAGHAGQPGDPVERGVELGSGLGEQRDRAQGVAHVERPGQLHAGADRLSAPGREHAEVRAGGTAADVDRPPVGVGRRGRR